MGIAVYVAEKSAIWLIKNVLTGIQDKPFSLSLFKLFYLFVKPFLRHVDVNRAVLNDVS